MKSVYYIGGSPCSGKSTVAELIAQKYGMYYFKVDDYLEKYTDKGAEQNKPICIKQKSMTPEQIWMRSPEEQCKEELQFYHEVFEFIIEDINNINTETEIITEGAAFLPDLMRQINIDKQHYINITPTGEFQILHYKQRPWVPYVLEGCKDKEAAFHNWMERDILFAHEVRRQSELAGYNVFITDGSISVDELMEEVLQSFKFQNEGE